MRILVLLVALGFTAPAQAELFEMNVVEKDDSLTTSFCEIDPVGQRLTCWSNPEGDGRPVLAEPLGRERVSTRVMLQSPGTVARKADGSIRHRTLKPLMADEQLEEELPSLNMSGHDWVHVELGPVDIVRGDLPLPASACNNAVECAQALQDSCDVTGQGVVWIMYFNGTLSTCQGTCSSGAQVDVTCVGG